MAIRPHSISGLTDRLWTLCLLDRQHFARLKLAANQTKTGRSKCYGINAVAINIPPLKDPELLLKNIEVSLETDGAIYFRFRAWLP